jgi:hypothetical protein
LKTGSGGDGGLPDFVIRRFSHFLVGVHRRVFRSLISYQSPPSPPSLPASS